MNASSGGNNYQRGHRHQEDRGQLGSRGAPRNQQYSQGRGNHRQFNAMNLYGEEFESQIGDHGNEDARALKDEAPTTREALGAINLD